MTRWKNEIKQAYAPPPPLRKREFLRNQQPCMSVPHFLLSQLGYIRKWVWLASALIYFTAIIVAWADSPYVVLLISACTPLLALTIISECGRSECYEMAELEMATRFSLRSVVLARLSLLGIFNLLLLVLLILIGCGSSTYQPFTVGIYISVPFLLACFLCLFISQTYRGQNGLYFCVGSTFCISIFVLFSHFSIEFIYEEQNIIWWTVGIIALCIGIWNQSVKIINQTEELLWN